MQSFPQCIVWMRIQKNWVRCIPCARFLYAVKLLSSLKPDVGLLYDKNFGENAYKRRAFIVRSHTVSPGELMQWIQEELQNLPSRRKWCRRYAYTSALCSPGLEPAKASKDKAPQPIIADALASEQNDDRSAKMYTARTFTQAILHCHGPMSRPSTCIAIPGDVSCHAM